MTPTQAFEAYCAAFAAGDSVAMADLFTEDGRFEASSLDEPLKGRSFLLQGLKALSRSSRNITTDIRIVLEGGEEALVEGAYFAEVIGTGGKLDGSPHRIDFKFFAHIVMRDGKIALLREIYDTRPFHPEERQRAWVINRRSPYWDETVKAKCKEWSVYNNMHFPMIYSRTPYEDYCALLEGVTLWDVGLERQTQIEGPDALAFVDYLCARDMSDMDVGDCRYSLVCDDDGKLMCDPVVLYPFPDTLWMSHGNTDLTLWARGIARDSRWRVKVSEPDVAPLQIQGPASLATLQGICAAGLAAMKNYTCLLTEVAGEPSIVSRTGWSGGYGFEVFPLSSRNAAQLWQAILETGRPHGIKVTGPIINRAIERGVTDINYYMNSDMNALEDLGAKLVDLDKAADFIGKAALQRISGEGVERHSVGLLFEADVPRMEWFWDLEGKQGASGEVRWAIYSFALERYIGIAVVDRRIAIGDRVTVRHPRGTATAEVTGVPFVKRGD
ncbi:MAG: nuclear transport factor 2 family protein [Hyphomicrobiales bacterium]